MNHLNTIAGSIKQKHSREKTHVLSLKHEGESVRIWKCFAVADTGQLNIMVSTLNLILSEAVWRKCALNLSFLLLCVHPYPVMSCWIIKPLTGNWFFFLLISLLTATPLLLSFSEKCHYFTCRNAFARWNREVIEPLALHVTGACAKDIWYGGVCVFQPHHQPFVLTSALEGVASQIPVGNRDQWGFMADMTLMLRALQIEYMFE